MFTYFIQNMIFLDRNKYVESNPYFTEKDCPFCENKIEEKNLIIFETKYWQLRYNKFPYYWYKQNLLAFPKKHKIYTTELTDNELIDYKNIEKFVQNFFINKNYFSFIRQWIWWRSIEHIHYHFLEWIIYHSGEKENKTFKIKNVS